MQLNRRGITLIELLIALVLLGIISAALYRVLVNNQRIYQAQTQRIDLQQNIRAAASILPAEFRELDASDGDIKTMTATSITIRAMRWLGFICNPPVLGLGLTNGLVMTIRQQPMFFGSRGINTATDSMFVFYDGNVNSRTDDAWAPARPTAVANLVCPDGNAGQTVTMNLDLASGGLPNVAGGITTGSPVRGFETVTYQLFKSDTSWYVGFQPAGGSMQPIIGPVLAGGLALAYYDSTGAVTANPLRVARIDITLRGRTAQPVRQTSGSTLLAATVDSVSTSVALRNNRRF